MKFELNVLFQSLSFRFLVKVWARSWMLKFYVEIGSLAQRLKFVVRWTAKFRSWGLKLKLELDAKSWASNLKLRWSLTSNIWSTVFFAVISSRSDNATDVIQAHPSCQGLLGLFSKNWNHFVLIFLWNISVAFSAKSLFSPTFHCL